MAPDNAEVFFPAGFHRTYSPGLDATSASLIAERDEQRRRDPNDPELEGLNIRITGSIASSSRQKWIETYQADRRTNPARFWLLLKGLAEKRSFVSPNQPIDFNGKVINKFSSVANHFVNYLLM